MAVDSPLNRVGFLTATADYSTSGGVSNSYTLSSGSGQFMCVKLGTAADYTFTLQTSAGAEIFGILQNQPASGAAGDIAINGVCKALAGGTITAGDELAVDSSARVTTASSTNHRIGKALGASAAGQLVAVQLFSTSRTTA